MFHARGDGRSSSARLKEGISGMITPGLIGPGMLCHTSWQISSYSKGASKPRLALSFRSSTMLKIGPGVRTFEGGKDRLNPWSLVWPGKADGKESGEWIAVPSGVEGCDSPSTTVLGRKRDAITIRWCLKELICNSA